MQLALQRTQKALVAKVKQRLHSISFSIGRLRLRFSSEFASDLDQTCRGVYVSYEMFEAMACFVSVLVVVSKTKASKQSCDQREIRPDMPRPQTLSLGRQRYQWYPTMIRIGIARSSVKIKSFSFLDDLSSLET